MYARAWARRAWIEHGNGLLKEHVGVLSSKVHAATVMMNRTKKARMCNAADDTRLVWVDLEVCIHGYLICIIDKPQREIAPLAYAYGYMLENKC